MSPIEVRGEGVVLRPWRLEDVPAVAAVPGRGNRALARLRAPAVHEEDARFYVQDCIDASDYRRPFAITDAETGDVIGSIDMRINRLQTGHVGYWLAAKLAVAG